VLAGGENVEPEPVETVIKTSPLIEQAVCVGQDQKGLGALLVPNFERSNSACRARSGTSATANCTASGAQAAARRTRPPGDARERLPAVRSVTTFRVLAEPMTPENGLLTQTLKVRRHVVAERYARIIAAMFDGKD
jgi:long-chain acyl-CoA synthetase